MSRGETELLRGTLDRSTATWTYVVTNTGNVNLTNVMVTDDRGVTVTCPQNALSVGQSMPWTAASRAP
jgi:hypothetical protein